MISMGAKTWCGAVVVGSLVAACGSGGGAPSGSTPASMRSSQQRPAENASAAQWQPGEAGGLESSEAVARAFAKVRNEGTVEEGLALFPSDAVVASVVTCSGASALTEDVAKARKRFADSQADMVKLRKEQPGMVTYTYRGVEETVSHEKGAAQDGCTWQRDVVVRTEVVSLDGLQTSLRLVVLSSSGRSYLLGSNE